MSSFSDCLEEEEEEEEEDLISSFWDLRLSDFCFFRRSSSLSLLLERLRLRERFFFCGLSSRRRFRESEDIGWKLELVDSQD